ncbi:MAG: type II toxin-antitoxin system RelE/ParE family toxin [Thermoguttaceae bacterium]
MKYRIFIQRPAQKDLAKIPNPYRDRIIQAIRELGVNPRPTGVKKLTGRNAWRIRISDYRIIYEIYDDKLVVVVITIGHRREIYR